MYFISCSCVRYNKINNTSLGGWENGLFTIDKVMLISAGASVYITCLGWTIRSLTLREMCYLYFEIWCGLNQNLIRYDRVIRPMTNQNDIWPMIHNTWQLTGLYRGPRWGDIATYKCSFVVCSITLSVVVSCVLSWILINLWKSNSKIWT